MGFTKYEARYDSLFESAAFKRIAHAGTGGRCCWCERADSAALHHAVYGSGDIIGQHLFPVCDWCHDKSNPIGVHSRDNWHRDKADPVFGNCNSPEAIEKLKAGYQRLVCSQRSKNSKTLWRPPG